MKFVEEQIDATHTRVAVFGGWVLTTYAEIPPRADDWSRTGPDYRIAQVVIPDENHEWTIEK